MKPENDLSLLEQALKKSGWRGPHQTGGGNAKTSFCIVNAQSVKNTDGVRDKGYDAVKKVSGIKRHIFVDSQGLPHAIAVTTANITDRQGALDAIAQNLTRLSTVSSLLVDGGYTGQPFADAVQRHELHTFAVLTQRWVVERSLA